MKTKEKDFRLVNLVPIAELGKPAKINEELLNKKSKAEEAYKNYKYLNSIDIVNTVYGKELMDTDTKGREVKVKKLYLKGVLHKYNSGYRYYSSSSRSIPRDEVEDYVEISRRLNQEPKRLLKLIEEYQKEIRKLVVGAEKELPKEVNTFLKPNISNCNAYILADDSSDGFTEYCSGGIQWEELNCEEVQNFREKYNNLTRVGLEQVKLLCDKLDFIIIPLEYLSSEAYKVDERYDESKLKEKIKEFQEMCDEVFDSNHQEYVVCPIQFLDLLSWTHDKEDRDVYFGKGLSIYSTTIQMNIPVFKSLWGNIENLNDRVTELEDLSKSIKGQVEVLNTNLKNLQLQVSGIGNQVKELKIQQARQSRSLESLETRTESLEAWRRCLEDPMIFSMPTKKLLRERKDSDIGVVGFCWGPDFPKELVYALQIATNTSKKSNIESWM